MASEADSGLGCALGNLQGLTDISVPVSKPAELQWLCHLLRHVGKATINIGLGRQLGTHSADELDGAIHRRLLLVPAAAVEEGASDVDKLLFTIPEDITAMTLKTIDDSVLAQWEDVTLPQP